MKKLLFLLAIIFFIPSASLAWWDSSWLNRRQITFSGVTSTAQLTDFPVLVSLNSSRIDYSKTQDSGQDIRFVDSNDTTALNYEIEKWDETATSTVWVKVPNVASSTTDYVYMYYNNTSASDNSTTTGVWDSNFKRVYHMKESPSSTSPQLRDSTANQGHIPSNGDMTLTDLVEGKIDGAWDFDGINDVIGSSTDSSPITDWQTGAGVNVSLWVKNWPPNTGTDGNGKAVFEIYDSVCSGCSPNAGARVRIGSDDYSPYNRVSIKAGRKYSANEISFSSLAGINTDWHFIDAYFSSSSGKLYIDGVFSNQDTTITTATAINMNTTKIGGGNSNGAGYRSLTYSTTTIDEVRVSNNVRSGAWIEAEYKNGVDTYNTYGSEESAPSATVSCSTDISSTAFGSMDSSAVYTSSSNASTTMSCSNTSSGCTLYVKDAGSGSNSGLWKSASPTYLITSADTTLSVGVDGYGIQATSTASGSGGTLSFNSSYNKTGNDVGGLTLVNTVLASSTVDVSGREAVATHKAAASSAAISGSYS